MGAKKEILTKDKIVSLYMNYVLEHGQNPKTVFHFAKADPVFDKKVLAISLPFLSL